jgi:hypothetical protein
VPSARASAAFRRVVQRRIIELSNNKTLNRKVTCDPGDADSAVTAASRQAPIVSIRALAWHALPTI